jgi:hypothetical protein
VDKIWFIIIGEQEEGPYSILDLKNDRRITPDTLVWRDGLPRWFPIRNVEELKEIFEDEKEPTNEQETQGVSKKKLQDNEVIALRQDPPYYYLWMIVALILVCYVIYEYYRLYLSA